MSLVQSKSRDSLKKRSLITFILLAFTRLGVFIPVPGIDHEAFFQNIGNNSTFRVLNVFSGGAVSHIGIFALGFVPYINASIFMQLLTTAIPSLEKLQKEEGEIGRRKISQYTRYLTCLGALVQGFFTANYIRPYVFNWSNELLLQVTLTLTTGSLIIMWIAELITEEGLGNGTSLLICLNITSGFPKLVQETFTAVQVKENFLKIFAVLSSSVLVLLLVIIMQESKRKISIVSPRQLISSNQSENKNFLPFRLNQSGVMPIIFASSISILPTQISQFVSNENIKSFLLLFSPLGGSQFIYLSTYLVFIVVFNLFYGSVILNASDISQNLKKMASTIPNVRPGIETEAYLKKTIKSLNFIGSIFLILISFIPTAVQNITKMTLFNGLASTSLIILVGTSVEIIKQIRTYDISQSYKDMS